MGIIIGDGSVRLVNLKLKRKLGTTLLCPLEECCGCLNLHEYEEVIIFKCNECGKEAGRADPWQKKGRDNG